MTRNLEIMVNVIFKRVLKRFVYFEDVRVSGFKASRFEYGIYLYLMFLSFRFRLRVFTILGGG